MEGIGNHKGGGGFETRRDANRLSIGNQDFVRIFVPDIGDILGIMPVYGANENTARDAQRFIADRGKEFFGRQNFAALHAINVWNDAFDFVDSMLGDPVRQIYCHWDTSFL